MTRTHTSDVALSADTASRFARLALLGIRREYPNKLDHVLNDDEDLLPPRRLHPAFYGCYDWHSAVHGHWLLAALRRLCPDLPEREEIRAALDEHLTPDNIAGEVEYLRRPGAETFERTYGWAWLLKLAEELRRPDAPSPAARWADALAPLADAFVQRYLDYLPRLTYPIRVGTHTNSAFGLIFAHDYAVATGHDALRTAVERAALNFFADDRSYPAHLEPGGADFLSPALVEAELMRRVLSHGEFSDWFARFLPDVHLSEPIGLFNPALVADRADPQIVHLDGLNLSRAWCFRNLARALPRGSLGHQSLEEASSRHLSAALPHVASGSYAGEHWLATFALLAIAG